MTARAKLWLCTFILGFALGIVVFYISGQEGKVSYQIGPLQEILLEGSELKEFTQTAHQLGTDIHIKAHASDRAGVKKALKAAFDRIHEIELIMTIHRPDSPLSRINASGRAKGYKVPEELGMVIAKSLELCRLTGGALDITVKPLLSAYRAASAHKRAPTDEEISSALADTGYQKVSVSEDLTTVTLADDGMALDLSATAKGYAADEAAKVLRESGIEHALVEAGGDIRVVGTRAGGQPWLTGIQNPEGKTGEYSTIIELRGNAVCTSGNYAQGYRLGKKRVSHIIDPRTGKPCDQNPSVTVVAPTAFTADALATALSVLGKDGLKIIEKMKDVEALVISIEDGRLIEHASSGFAGLLQR